MSRQTRWRDTYDSTKNPLKRLTPPEVLSTQRQRKKIRVVWGTDQGLKRFYDLRGILVPIMPKERLSNFTAFNYDQSFSLCVFPTTTDQFDQRVVIDLKVDNPSVVIVCDDAGLETIFGKNLKKWLDPKIPYVAFGFDPSDSNRHSLDDFNIKITTCKADISQDQFWQLLAGKSFYEPAITASSNTSHHDEEKRDDQHSEEGLNGKNDEAAHEEKRADKKGCGIM